MRVSLKSQRRYIHDACLGTEVLILWAVSQKADSFHLVFGIFGFLGKITLGMMIGRLLLIVYGFHSLEAVAEKVRHLSTLCNL